MKTNSLHSKSALGFMLAGALVLGSFTGCRDRADNTREGGSSQSSERGQDHSGGPGVVEPGNGTSGKADGTPATNPSAPSNAGGIAPATPPPNNPPPSGAASKPQ